MGMILPQPNLHQICLNRLLVLVLVVVVVAARVVAADVAVNDDNNNDDNDDDPATTTNTILALLLFVPSTFADSLRRQWDLQGVSLVSLIVLVSSSSSSANLIKDVMGIVALNSVPWHVK